MDISVITGVATGLVELSKKVLDASNKVKNKELNQVVLELQQKLLEVQPILYSLQEENRKLREHINNLERSKIISDNIVFKNRAYYLLDNEEEKGPYCTRCWDAERKLVRLLRMHYTNLCPNCKNKT